MAALSAAEQVKAVAARLKELNPGFDGFFVPTIENGVVRELGFKTDDVTDISPAARADQVEVSQVVPALETAIAH